MEILCPADHIAIAGSDSWLIFVQPEPQKRLPHDLWNAAAVLPTKSAISVMLFSALFSSSFSGAVYIGMLFVQGGRICSDLLEQFRAQKLLEDATDRAAAVFRGVPRAAITIGILILALWLISFVQNLLRYGRFRIRIRIGIIMYGLEPRTSGHFRYHGICLPLFSGHVSTSISPFGSRHAMAPVSAPFIITPSMSA